MKKLFIAASLLAYSFLSKAQDTVHVNINMTVAEARIILNGLGELKLKESLPIYMSVQSQAQTQINAIAQKQQEALIPKSDSSATKKEKPTVKK